MKKIILIYKFSILLQINLLAQVNHICVSGNCDNGYGVMESYDRDNFNYMTNEGYWINGRLVEGSHKEFSNPRELNINKREGINNYSGRYMPFPNDNGNSWNLVYGTVDKYTLVVNPDGNLKKEDVLNSTGFWGGNYFWGEIPTYNGKLLTSKLAQIIMIDNKPGNYTTNKSTFTINFEFINFVNNWDMMYTTYEVPKGEYISGKKSSTSGNKYSVTFDIKKGLNKILIKHYNPMNAGVDYYYEVFCDPNNPNELIQTSNSEIPHEQTSISNSITRPKIWAVCVGVSDYSQELNYAGLQDLTYCNIDAKKVYDFFKSPNGGSVPTSSISLLMDKEATSNKIISECRRIFGQASEGDLIIFYFSGHGGVNLFCTHDGHLKHEELKSVIYNSPARKKICIADACHAGSWNKNSTFMKKSSLISQREDLLYQSLAASGSGVALLMASQSDETSIDDYEFKQGLFTYYLLEGLNGYADKNNNKVITISELYGYLKNKVSVRGLARWNNPQTPQLNGDYDANMPVGVSVN